MSILKTGQTLTRKKLIRDLLPSLSAVLPADRTYCDFAHKWMPGPHPKTKEERDYAARKYNLIPEDYVPLPEEEAMGDYPYIHRLSHQQQARPYWQVYDEPFTRRNYGEPLSEFYVSQEYEPIIYEIPKKTRMLNHAIFWGMVFLITFSILGPEYEIHKTKPKQYPPEYFVGVRPKKHYLFESND